jgi:hypothetical protein
MATHLTPNVHEYSQAKYAANISVKHSPDIRRTLFHIMFSVEHSENILRTFRLNIIHCEYWRMFAARMMSECFPTMIWKIFHECFHITPNIHEYSRENVQRI